MYEKDFFERLNLQQLCAFLRTGGRLSPKAVEHGTLWERIRRAEDAWEAAMKAYRDKILTTDWSDLPPRGEAAVLEELQGGIMDAECRLESLYFEAGFHAGIRIGWELAAALGEEGGLIQDNVPLSPLDGGAGENLGGEGAAVAVLVVEFGCHSGGVPVLWILFLFLGHDGVFHQQVLDGLVQKTGGGDAGLRG